jgi:hypothetical protein
MSAQNSGLRNFTQGGLGYLAGAGLGLLFVLLISWIGVGEWLVNLLPEGQDFIRLLGIVLVTALFLGLGGAFIGAVGGYFLNRIAGIQGRTRLIWGGGIAYGLTTGVLLLVFLLLIAFIGIYNNFNTNQIEQFGLLFGLFGLVYGLVAGLLQGLLTLRLKYAWRVILAAPVGYLLGGAILGLIVRWVNPTESFQVAPILTLLLLLLGLSAPFFLGGGLLGWVHGRFARRIEAAGEASQVVLPPRWQTILFSVIGLLLAVAVVGFLSDVTGFLTIQPAELESQLTSKTTGVWWSQPQAYTPAVGEFSPAAADERVSASGIDGSAHQAWCSSDGTIHYQHGTGPEEQIEFPGCTRAPAIAVDADGKLHLVWYTQELMDATGVLRDANVLVESVWESDGWSEAAIAAFTQGPVTQSLAADDQGLTLIWEEPSRDRYYAQQQTYACSADALSPPELAGLQAILDGDFWAADTRIPYCGNRFDRIIYTPNPEPAYSDEPITQNGGFDRISALTDVAQYEVLFTTMQWEPNDPDPSPGKVFASQVAHLYQAVKASPENYPRGMTVRILLGNYPVVSNFNWGDQIIDAITVLREAGVESMLDPEIGWRMEVANYSGTYPHAHTKFIVVDGKGVAAAGFNYGYLHLPKSHPSGKGFDMLDLGMQITGPVAQDSIVSYDDMWQGADQITCQDFFPADGSNWQDSCQELKAEVSHVPEVLRYFLPQNGATKSFSLYRTAKFKEADAFISASLASAEESIDMMQVNFSLDLVCMANLVFPGVCTIDDALPYMNAMLDAMERNPVHVRVIMENTNSNGLENRISGQIFLDELERRGLGGLAELRFYNGKLHAKSTLIDEKLLIIGSMNMHYSSWGESGLSEYALTTDDPDAIAEYQGLFETKWAEAIPFEEAQFSSSP